MKQIILIFCLGFILNSCKKEPLAIADIDTSVIFNLKLTRSIPPSKTAGSTLSVGDINDISILVFEDGGSNNYLYRRSGITPVGNNCCSVLSECFEITFALYIILYTSVEWILVFRVD